MNQSLNWRQLASLKAGGAICLPVILAGHALCQNYGLTSALFAIGMGNLILLSIALIMSKMSFEAKLNTTDNAIRYFGPPGSKFFAAALLFAKSNWIAIQLNLMAVSAIGLLPSAPHGLLCLLLGLVVILVASQGISALSFVTSLSLPLLLATMGYALFGVVGKIAPVRDMLFSYTGISLAIATAITAVIDMPTYFRHAKTKRDGYIAVFLFLGLAVPLVEGIGVILCHYQPGLNVLETLKQEGSFFWNNWVALFLILAGWATNNSNLYSASACLGTILPKLSEKVRVALIGAFGILFATMGILEHFSTVLQLIGIMTGSMGAAILVSYLLKSYSPKLNLISWGIGVFVGVVSLLKIITLTQIPLVDAGLVAALATLILQKGKRYETAYD